jgi:hypothetical protein
MLVAGAMVAGVGALAVAGVVAYNRWTADPNAPE